MHPHSHHFLGGDHARAEQRSWAVIALCLVMMALEIGGGLLWGSIALVADGLHMSTHAGAMLLAALAYRFARTHAADTRFSFGTGKFGDLAGFTSAIVLGLIALLIGYEAVTRFFAPVTIRFNEAIPIAVLGLAVNIASVWLLSGGGHAHHHHDHGHDHAHDHAAHGRDNNMRAAVVHVAADAFVSVFVIIGLVLARSLGWLWLDPAAGLLGAVVIASWAAGLLRDTGAILLDMEADPALCATIKNLIEAEGDRIADLHVWRLGPGHLGAIVSVITPHARTEAYYRRLPPLTALSHLTIEILPAPNP